MARQRDLPSLKYRTPNLVHVSFPVTEGIPKVRVRGAARLNDAYGNVAGVGGGGSVAMFEVAAHRTHLSDSIRRRGVAHLEENTRGRTTAIWDSDDYATPLTALGTTYLPSDEQTLFLRLEPYSEAAGAYLSQGPILVVPPYDFLVTPAPVFTVTGTAPNLAIGVFPPNLPDLLLGSALNLLLPAYSVTFSLCNLDAATPIFFSCAPGTPPSVVMPEQETTLTGAGAPELFIAAPNGNPWFTLRVAVANGS